MGAQALVEDLLQPEGAEEEQRRKHRKRVVMELGRGEGEDREADEEPEEQEEHRPLPRALRPHPHPREDGRGPGKREHPGEAVEADLLDEIGERPARRRGVDAERQPLEVIVDDEALEERLPLVVAPVEREHRAVPGGADGEDDQRSGCDVQPAQAVPLAGDHAVEERHRAGEREPEQPLGERGEPDEAVERRRPAVARLLVLEEDDHQAGHRPFEEPDEHRVRHGLPGEEHEERAGEDGERSQHRAAAAEQPVCHHEQQHRPERGDGGVREAHAPFGVDARPAVGAVGVRHQHARGHQPEVERGLGEEPGRLPPGVDVIAARDHLPRHLAVMRLPGIPEAGRSEPGKEEERGERHESDQQAPLGAQRPEPGEPGDLAHEPRKRIAPVGERRRFEGCLRSRHRVPRP